MSHSLEWYKEYANENNLVLGKNAEKVIAAVDKCEGYCPCKYALMKKSNPEKLHEIICPCKEHKNEIEKLGHCHCCLFYKKEE